MNSKQQNKGIPIPQPALNFKLLILAILFLLLVGGKIFGASPFTDNFDSYSGTDLNDNSDWIECPVEQYWSFQISTTTNFSEPNSAFAQQSGFGRCSEKTGNQIGTGSLTFWANISGGTSANSSGIVLSGATSSARFLFDGISGDISYYSSALTIIPVCNVESDVWFWLAIEWNHITDKVKYTCETIGQTSGWVDATYEADIQYFDKIKMVAVGNHANTYIDDIGTMSVCSLYLGHNACIEAGCSWYYSIYLQEYSCVSHFIPDPDECGSFYKCQYCGDQTICEAELNCEWENRGFGNQCYMAEPTIPPDQADWEIPDIDDCSGLPALDTIVCEIKNLINSAFMPSQEKIEELYQTLGAFKERFPFNYLASLDSFFSEITEDLEETKTIPIKILGATSTVSFTFWDATTTIGGQEETFKNILFDFTSFIVVMGWFVWFISLIKRFF